MRYKYTAKHFKVQELVTPYAFQRLGSDALMLMDDRILIALDTVREVFDKPITVNNWHIGGGFTQRGWRDDSETGAKFSQHRFGRAVDFDVSGFTAKDAREVILEMWPHSDALKYITRMEDGVSWLHIDCAPIVVNNGPILFNP